MPKHPTLPTRKCRIFRPAFAYSLQPRNHIDSTLRSHYWRRKNQYFEWNACVQTSFTEGELLYIRKKLAFLIGRYGPADFLIDDLIDNAVTGFLAFEFEDGSIVLFFKDHWRLLKSSYIFEAMKRCRQAMLVP